MHAEVITNARKGARLFPHVYMSIGICWHISESISNVEKKQYGNATRGAEASETSTVQGYDWEYNSDYTCTENMTL